MRRALLLLSAMLAGDATAEITPGEYLIAEMNCVACHQATPELAARLASRPSPRIGADGVKLSPEWIRQFLAEPQKVKPGTLMPDVLHGLPTDEKPAVIEALTHYWVSVQGGAPQASTPSAKAELDAGAKLYHEIGCVQCHAPSQLPPHRTSDAANLEALEHAKRQSVPLFGTATTAKMGVNELAEFLADPLKTRPGGRMPTFHLTPAEARQIAAWLLRDLPAAAEDTTFQPDPAKVAEGAQHFHAMRCAACHTGGPAGPSPTPARPLAELRPRQPVACFSSNPRFMAPKFTLTERQRTVLLATLQNQAALSAPLEPAQQIRRTMTALNCFACHSRDKRGGGDAFRREYYTTIGGPRRVESDRVPPTLQGVGVRHAAPLLRELVLGGVKTRPRMTARMPGFGEANVGHLPSLLEKADRPQKQ